MAEELFSLYDFITGKGSLGSPLCLLSKNILTPYALIAKINSLLITSFQLYYNFITDNNQSNLVSKQGLA